MAKVAPQIRARAVSSVDLPSSIPATAILTRLPRRDIGRIIPPKDRSHEHRPEDQRMAAAGAASRAKRRSRARMPCSPGPTCRCGRRRTSSASMRSGSTGTWASPSTSPRTPAQVARGADGKKIGIFLLHGGSGDYKSMEPMAKLFAGKFGCKAVAMTFPGRLYLDDPSRDWPGDTINRRRHRAHADLAQGRAHHAGPIRGGARHLDAHALRHPHGRAREARHHLLRPHGGVAGGVRGRHEGRHAPALSRPANSRSTSPAIRPAGRWCS